jgi:hypothetical protein
MTNYLIGVGVLFELLMVANYIHHAIQAKSNTRDRIQYILIALFYGLLGLMLLIGFIKFNLLHDKK